jgi:hypothetical protein
MGASLHKAARPPDVDLLPPRFERQPSAMDRVTLSPFEYLFGVEKRDKLFSSYFASANTATLHAAIRPDVAEKMRIALATDVSRLGVVGDSFGVGISYSDVFPEDVAGGKKWLLSSSPNASAAWQGQLRVGSDGSLRGTTSLFDEGSGIGMYGIFPADAFLARKFAANLGEDPTTASSSSSSSSSPLGGAPPPPSPPGVGFGIGGPPVRYTHQQARPNPAAGSSSADAANTSASALPVSPRNVTPAPADAGDVSAMGGRAGASAACSSSSSMLYPEVGMRYINAEQGFSIGGHLGIPPGIAKSAATFTSFSSSSSPSIPLKVWGVGGTSGLGSGGTITAGLQLATDSARLMGSTGSGSSRYDLDAAVSLSQPPLYEVSLALDSVRREVVAGYTHSLTVRRKVYNPLEPAHVRGIYQYVDLGFEVRRKLEPPFSSTLALAASLQLNRSALLKARVGSRDASASLALKTWTDPSVTLCVTGVWDRAHNDTGIGVFLSMERGGALQYQKAVLGAQTAAPSQRLQAAPHLNASRTRSVDMKPFDESLSEQLPRRREVDAVVGKAGGKFL